MKGFLVMERERPILKLIRSFRKRISLRAHWYSYAAKRLMDIVASLLGLLLLAPCLAVIALLIKRDSPGPVFYRGPRAGKDGRIFQILKFRTMREEPDSYTGPGVTAEDDPRITSFGKWLRDTKLNELPQLWNVLAGQMSLVGPRPELPEIAATWPEALRREVLFVRPGITSPASVAYHDEEQRLKAAHVMEDYLADIVPDKLRLDQLYVRHHTFMTDLDALFWTFVILIPRLKNVKIPEGWLFGGPLTRLLRRYVSRMMIDFVGGLPEPEPGRFGLAPARSAGYWPGAGLRPGHVTGGHVHFVYHPVGGEERFLGTGGGHGCLPPGPLVWPGQPGGGLPAILFAAAGGSVHRFCAYQRAVDPGGFVVVRYRLRLVTGLANFWITWRGRGYGAGERVLIVGAGQGSELAAWLLGRSEFRRLYTAVGIVDDNPAKQGMRLDGLPVLGTTADIPELVKRHDIGVLYYAIVKIDRADEERILATCRKTGLRLIMLSELLRALHGHLTASRPCNEAGCPLFVPAEHYAPVKEVTP